jgi:glycosyltransferase involved in cell wall biosynthesis
MVDANLVSVVIPTYNAERFLARTLETALGQSYTSLEIIVVDDGSTDGSQQIAEAAARKDPRVRYFRRKNSGVAASRNFGISQARGELIATLDADDLWNPDKIARQVDVMRRSSSEVGLVYCLAIEIDESDLIIPPIANLEKKRTPMGRVTDELVLGNFIETSSAPLMKRSFIEAVGGYDKDLEPQGAEDWKLYFSLSEVCEFAVIPEHLVGYRQPTGSLSRNTLRMAHSIDLVRCWILERRPDLSLKLRRLMVYYASVFMAQRSLDNGEFGLALRYSARGYRAYPKGLLERPLRAFVLRFSARFLGVRRGVLRKRGIIHQVKFSEFRAQHFSTGM